MASVGSQTTFVSGVNGVVALTPSGGSANTYAASRSFKAEWGNNIEQEKVGGTDIPIVNTAEFKGSGELVIIYSTENTSANEQLSKMLALTNGQIPSIGLTWTGQDVQTNTREFTWSGTVWPQNVSLEQNGPSVIAMKISFIFSNLPTLS